MFANVTPESFQRVTAPKALGATNLYPAFSQTPKAAKSLDFFLVTSSISSALGNPGQASYAAANSLLDSLATDQCGDHERNGRPINVVSLGLPVIAEIGVVAEGGDKGEAIEIGLTRRGMYGIDEEEMLNGFEAAIMAASCTSEDMDALPSRHIIMGLDPQRLARTISAVTTNDQANLNLYWYSDVRLSHIRSTVDSILENESSAADRQPGSGSGGARTAGNGLAASVRDAIKSEDSGAAADLAARFIAERMSAILMITAERLQSLDDQSLSSLGLDSMIGTEMRSWLFREFGLDLPFQKLLAPSLTAKALAEDIVAKLKEVEA